jgi:hypothetical protein
MCTQLPDSRAACLRVVQRNLAQHLHRLRSCADLTRRPWPEGKLIDASFLSGRGTPSDVWRFRPLRLHRTFRRRGIVQLVWFCSNVVCSYESIILAEWFMVGPAWDRNLLRHAGIRLRNRYECLSTPSILQLARSYVHEAMSMQS